MHRRLCLQNIPVLLFHSVRTRGAPMEGPGGALSIEADLLERGLIALRDAGYQTIRCHELVDALAHGAPLPARPLLLTFDDGWLDNWTVATPVLARVGLHATLFVATDLIEAGDRPRPTLADVAAGNSASLAADVPQQGFVRAAELRAMEASGVFEVQAHSASHAVLAEEGARTIWFGERGPSESDAAQRARIADDLKRCRTRLRELLGHDVDYLAWPGGGVSRAGLDVALREAGFRATFLTNEWASEVVPSATAIPRVFFSQHWRGPLADTARVLKLRGVVDFESGAPLGYARLFAANRLMEVGRLLGAQEAS